MPRTLPLLLALALLLPGAALLAAPAAAATTRVVTISTASTSPDTAFKAFDADPPKLFDFNGDGKLEIIDQNDNRGVYVFDSQTGALLAQLTTTYPTNWGARPINGPEAAVMVKGGLPHMLIANSASILTDFVFDPGASTATHFVFTKLWERRMSDCHQDPGQDSKPVLADLDRDGKLDILMQTEEVGVYAIRSNGQLMWKDCIGGGNGEPGVGDLNGDGWPEVVWCSDGGVVTATSGRTGGIQWSYNLLHHFNLGSGSMPVGPAIADLDGDGKPDVVVGARDSHDAVDWSNDHALLLALNSWGGLLWARQPSVANPLTYTHPIVADVDGDGKPDVIWGDWNTIGHKPPWKEADAWKVTGPAHFYRFDSKGNLRWTQTLGTFWSNKDLALADVTGDGVQDVLANGPSGGEDGIWYLNSVTGAKEQFVSTWPWKVTRGPIVADLWGTGTMQWVVPVFAYGSGSSGGGIQVYDTHQPWSAMWPHLPYPSAGDAVSPPTGSGGAFNATFTIAHPNEWWEQVTVSAPGHAITSVQVRVDGAPWADMAQHTWGWTASVHAPAGSQVEFLATDSSGGQSQSLPFAWLDGTLTQGSTAPGGGGSSSGGPPFTPIFELSPNVGEWWEEVKVRTTDPMKAVDMSVDGGAWQALKATSWGTWAASLHVPAGSKVQFRATNAFDQTALSSVYTWLSGGGASFAATFHPHSVGNDWWVEVGVDSASAITGVDARLDGGTWQALTLQSWGNWARSLHAPDGTIVEFRAHDDVGNTAASAPVTWT
jgi:hypothetical protein